MIYFRDVDKDGNAGEWKEAGRKTLGIDYQAGETISIDFPADMEKLREVRISAISYKDEESIYSRVQTLERDHVEGEIYLEAKPHATGVAVALKWSPVDGTQGYRVERKENGKDDWETIANYNYSYRHNNSVTSGKTYTYRIATETNAEYTIYSNEVTIEAPNSVTEKAKKIYGLSVSEGDAQVTFTWHQTNSIGVNIVRISDGGLKTTVTENNTTGRFTDDGLTNGKTYKYILTPVNSKYKPTPKDVEENLSLEVTATPQKDQFIHIPFNDGPGLTARDEFGGAHASIFGGFKWEKNEAGSYDAVTLKPSYYGYIEVPATPFKSLNNRTYLIDVKIPEGCSGPIFHHGHGNSIYKNVALNYDPDAEKPFSAVIENEGFHSYSFDCPANSGDMRIAFVTDSGNIYLYINGEKAGEAENVEYPDFSDKYSSYFRLGTSVSIEILPLGFYNSFTHYAPFTFEDLRVYDRALTESEIRDLSATDGIEESLNDCPASGIRVHGGKGVITISSSIETSLSVYSIDGSLITTSNVTPGKTTINGIIPGIYIVEGRKIIVR